MGNNPTGMIDPDGGWGGWLTAFGHWVAGGFEGKLHKSSEYGDWGINKASNNTVYTTEDGGLGIKGNTDYGGKRYNNNAVSFSDVASSVWNSNFVRSKINDQYSIGISEQTALFFGYQSSPINFTLLTRGEQGIYYTPSGGASLGNGAEFSLTVAYSQGNYTGNPRNIKSSMLQGHSAGASIGLGIGLAGSIGASYAPVDRLHPISGGGFTNVNANLGIGLDVGVTAASFQGSYNYTPIVVPLLKL